LYVSGGEVTTLSHESRNHTVKFGSLVTEALGAGAELTEVVGGPGNDIIVELEHNSTPVVLWIKEEFGQSNYRDGQDWGTMSG
jgi:hypothetical protein